MGDEYELERLRAELAQEKEMKEMLDQSLRELQVTVDELEKRVDGVQDEGNEWKTRYETQLELNQQVSKQVIILGDKVEEAKRNVKESRQPKTFRSFDDAPEATPTYVQQLSKEKNTLESQLRDLEWRLDQESKAYHKANEERKNYVMEISSAKNAIEAMKQRQRDQLGETPRGSNIPSDRRIIDAQRGPIKKTAAVKNLPSLY